MNLPSEPFPSSSNNHDESVSSAPTTSAATYSQTHLHRLQHPPPLHLGASSTTTLSQDQSQLDQSPSQQGGSTGLSEAGVSSSYSNVGGDSTSSHPPPITQTQHDHQAPELLQGQGQGQGQGHPSSSLPPNPNTHPHHRPPAAARDGPGSTTTGSTTIALFPVYGYPNTDQSGRSARPPLPTASADTTPLSTTPHRAGRDASFAGIGSSITSADMDSSPIGRSLPLRRDRSGVGSAVGEPSAGPERPAGVGSAAAGGSQGTPSSGTATTGSSSISSRLATRDEYRCYLFDNDSSNDLDPNRSLSSQEGKDAKRDAEAK
jgi:hypothetical protein